jgi:hypothetical protein
MIKINKNNQEGLASIFISMIMMIVITLLVLGFVQFANKEAAQVLNRQLSVAAFYAAETGINIVKSQEINGALPSQSQIGCSGNTYSTQGLFPGTSASIPCLLVYSSPIHLYKTLGLGSSWITPIDVNGASSINYLTIGWQNLNMTTPPAKACFGLSPSNLGPEVNSGINTGRTCDAGVIKVDLVPANSIQTEYTYYFYPQPVDSPPSTTNVIPYTSNSSGVTLPGSCPGSNGLSQEYCNVTLNLSGLNQANYYLRIKTFYLPASIEISAETSNPNEPGYQNISFGNDQIVVDSTGKVSNVLQRIRVNLGTNYSRVPNSALNITQGICKQFYYYGQYVVNSSNQLGGFGCNTF